MKYRVFASTLLIAALVACGKNSSNMKTTTINEKTVEIPLARATASGQSATHDPCSLLTKADVEAATHKPVGEAKQSDDTHCTYLPKSGAMGAITVEASWKDAGAQFAGGQGANAMMGQGEKTPKVGDASYSSAMGNLFYARKGDAYVGIDMRAAAVPVKVVGPELARKALAKM